MSTAPRTIYIDAKHARECRTGVYTDDRIEDSDLAFVSSEIAYGYASEVEKLRERVAALESTLRQISDSHHLPEHGLKCMASDALTKEG